MRRILTVFVLLFVALVAATCNAQSGDAQHTKNVVRLNVGTSWGSGVYLGDGLVLTCAHVFRDEATRDGYVWFPDGDKFAFKWLAINNYWDQGLVEIQGTPDEKGVPIAKTNPKPGETVYAAGYGRANKVQITTGRVIKYKSPGQADPLDWFTLTGYVNEGSSGGPIFNTNGGVVGNLWGTSNYETVGIMTGRTRRFLFPWNARLQASAIRSGVYPRGSRMVTAAPT